MADTDNDDPLGILDDPFGVLDAVSDVSPITSLPPQGTKEHRKGTRYSASWKVTIAVDNQMHDGRTKDISLHGAAVMNRFNLKPATSVTLHLHLPSLTGPAAPRIVMIHGVTSYAIHDSTDLCFRVGITFTRFEQPSDRLYLEERLTNHHPKVL